MNRKFISNSSYVLSRILNNEENLDIVKDFIENILEIKIIEIKLMNISSMDTKGIVNVQVITINEEKKNIGIQIIDGNYIQEKIFIYGSAIHVNQIYDDYLQTITINIIDIEFFSSNEYINKIDFIENNMIFYVIEIPKFKKRKIENKIDAWMSYLKSDSIELVNEAKQKNNKINKLDKNLDAYWINEEL